MRELRTQVRLARSVDEVFSFFADARNLERLTPPWVRFKIGTPGPIDMRVGAIIDYTIRVHAVPLRWTTRISAWDPPHRFEDVQIRGPYRAWIHEHTFEPIQGGVLCGDFVRYQSRLGWLTHPLFVDRDVRRIFEYRSRALIALFGGL